MHSWQLSIRVLASIVAMLGLILMPHMAVAANHSVSVVNFAFSPATLQIAVGDSVTWTNNDGSAHTTTSDSGAWDSLTVAPGGTFQQTFLEPGIYPYYCTFHPSMQGTIRVGNLTYLPLLGR